MNLQIKDYVIEQQIGQGQSSIVFKAHKINQNDQYVALKQFRGVQIQDSQNINHWIVQLFSKEMNFYSIINQLEAHLQQNQNEQLQNQRLDIKYINKLLDAFKMEVNNSCFYILIIEYASNGDLADLLCQIQYIPGEIAKLFIEQSAQAIRLLHKSLNLAHMDIKTPNMLLDQNFNLKLTDFGLIDSRNQATEKVGTPGFTAPEVYKQEAYNPQQADIFSLGCTFIEIRTGIPPFGINQPDMDLDVYKKLQEDPEKYWNYINEQTQQYGYEIELEPLFKDLVQSMLNIVPNKRPNIEQVLRHPYFQLYQQIEQTFLIEFMRHQLIQSQVQQANLSQFGPQKTQMKQKQIFFVQEVNFNTFVIEKNETYKPFSRILKFFDSFVQESKSLIFDENELEKQNKKLEVELKNTINQDNKENSYFLHRYITDTNKTCSIGIILKETQTYYEFKLIGLKGDQRQQNLLKKQFRQQIQNYKIQQQ